MKKNKALTAAISVLSLTMVSMCAIGGTFAKYTTNGKADDTAKVAAWGVKVAVTADKANTVTDTDGAGNETDVVEGTSVQNVIAPGTKDNLLNIKVTGTPEVSYKISVDVDLELEDWQVDGVDYCPLVFTVGTTPYKIGDVSIDTVEKLESAVEKAIGLAVAGSEASETVFDTTGHSYEKEYTFGTPVPATGNDFNVDWQWAFEVNDVDNVKDTALADKADTGDPATVSLKVSIKVDQVD